VGRARALVVGAGLVALLAACSANSATSEPTPSGSTGAPVARSALDCGDTLREVAANAKKEGHLTLIGVPQDWANYGQILDSFREDYGIDVRVMNPDASSGEELATVKEMAGDPGRPDVVDLSPTFAHQARVDGLLQPYRSTTWAQIPAGLKDPDGYWVGSYYGIMAIGTNTKFQPNVPSGWVDLRAPRYKGQVGMDGDPRTSGAGFGAVVAAALANGGSFDDVLPGIRYFADLKKAGNLKVIEDSSLLLTAKAPISLQWLFTFPRAQDGGSIANTLQVTIPADAVYGSYYAQAITADAPHPCAAALWIEQLNGDSGALSFLQGRALPARFAALEAFGLVGPDVRTKLPRPNQIYGITFPTADQLAKMKSQIDQYWGPLVADK